MKLREINESIGKITKDSFIAYDLTDPKGIHRYGTGYQGKQPFRSKSEAKSSFGRDNEDIVVTTIEKFEKEFKVKIL